MQSKDKIIKLLNRQGQIRTREVAEVLGVSRNYAQRLLQELIQEGEILLIGKTNQARYVSAKDAKSIKKAREQIRHISLHLKNEGLSEDEVFRRVESETGIFIDAAKNVRTLVYHAFTEMVNNAIDHSRSENIQVDCRRSNTVIVFVVRDYGVGVFNDLVNKFRLPGTLAAIQELLKGKATTDPERHSGEGIFFTSKMADVFVIDSYEKRLTINNLIPDIFIRDRKPLKGTRVTFSVHLKSKKTVNDVFKKFTEGEPGDSEFNKTKVSIKLFEFGTELPSRSLAKRVVTNLDKFDQVELDFANVETAGQGFADEIFRVWQSRNPSVQLRAVNANPNVAFMIKRAGGEVE